ncbi:MAG: hypothetical protein DRQ56_09595 [Gammaproteobacteria bacterium]|nr:MAG: hypothetical protein DRQ56_09595 [Gammaproteobacteria bacterium]
MDLDRDGIPYLDTTRFDCGPGGNEACVDTLDENPYILSRLLEAPDAFRRAANRNDFIVVANGTAAWNEELCWIYDGALVEHYNNGVYPGDDTEFTEVMSEKSTWFDNSRVNPPLLMFYAYQDSTGLTAEAYATIANGVAMFINDERHVSAAGPLIDLTRPASDNHLDIGDRVLGSVVLDLSDGFATAKFWNGVDTTYVSTVGYTGTLPWPYLIITGTDTISVGSERDTDRW